MKALARPLWGWTLALGMIVAGLAAWSWLLACSPSEMTTLSGTVATVETDAKQIEPILGGACAILGEVPALSAVDIICAGVEAADAFVANLPPLAIMSRTALINGSLPPDASVRPVLYLVRVSLAYLPDAHAPSRSGDGG